MPDFKFKMQYHKSRVQNLSVLEAHVELGKIAQKKNLATYVHEGDWTEGNEFSIAYKRGGNILLDAVAYVQKMAD